MAEKRNKDKDLLEMTLSPVGTVKSEAKQPNLVIKSGDLDWRGLAEGIPKVRIFATNNPVKPNSICVTVVPLAQRQEKALKVKGLNARRYTYFDIKPYYPGYYAVSEEVKRKTFISSHLDG